MLPALHVVLEVLVVSVRLPAHHAHELSAVLMPVDVRAQVGRGGERLVAVRTRIPVPDHVVRHRRRRTTLPRTPRR